MYLCILTYGRVAGWTLVRSISPRVGLIIRPMNQWDGIVALCSSTSGTRVRWEEFDEKRTIRSYAVVLLHGENQGKKEKGKSPSIRVGSRKYLNTCHRELPGPYCIRYMCIKHFIDIRNSIRKYLVKFRSHLLLKDTKRIWQVHLCWFSNLYTTWWSWRD